MKRMIILAMAVACVVLGLKTNSASPQTDALGAPATKLTPLMRMKLDRSKGILEGLAMEEFDTIASNARALRLLSTEAGWNVIQTPEYAAQSRDFQRATDLIVEAAENKDIHRAAMGYVALTVRCVECHSYMRKHRTASERSDRE